MRPVPISLNDRFIEQTLWTDTAGELSYLGESAVCEAVVRDFVSGILLRAGRAGKADGTMSVEEAAGEDLMQAARFMEIIAGRDPNYTPIDGWNASETGGLKSWVRNFFDDDFSPVMLAKPDGPYEAIASMLLARTYDLLRSISRGATDDALRDEADAIVEDGRRMLLGIPLGDLDQ